MADESVAHRVNRILRARAAASTLKIPPPCLLEMKAEYVEFDEAGRRLVMRFPVEARYENPLRYMQGGFIAAAIDNTLGPLSFLVAPPSVTTQLTTQFLRPVSPDTGHLVVHGRVDEMTKGSLFLSARVTDPRERTLAIAYASCQILPPP
jgi:acyl-coenzyme A thioesterase PaaI-like protein